MPRYKESLSGTPGERDTPDGGLAPPSGGPRQAGGADTPLRPEPCADALLRELDALRAVLAGRAEGIASSAPRNRLVVVARFLPDLTPEAWNALARYDASGESKDGRGHSPWFALDLDPEEYPQLSGLCRTDAPPLGPVCPLTAALLPDPFLNRIAAEIAGLPASGGEATLAIFGVGGAPAGSAQSPGGADSAGAAAGQTSEAVLPLDQSLRALVRIMRRHARACDIPGRPARDRLALLMPGVGPFRARALAERIIASFQQEAAPAGAIRAGLACCDSDAPVPAALLLARAETALAQAQPGFSHTFRKAGMPEPERRTQVQACEKAFLFFGDSEQV